MILREPISIFLGVVLALVALSSHVDKVETKKEHALKVHYLKMHPNAYNAEVELRIKQKEALRKARRYRVKDI